MLGRVVMVVFMLVVVVMLGFSYVAVVVVGVMPGLSHVVVVAMLGGRQRRLLARLGHLRVSFLNGAYDRLSGCGTG